jgi:glycosyltransferase involved in cell wall biosynthesis
MTIDVVYVAWNRLAFTGRTFDYLLRNTDWTLVSKLIVYDDGSEDGTQEHLRGRYEEAPVPAEMRVSDFRSPPAVMNHYLATAEADRFAKIDCDIACPPRWLNALNDVMDKNPDVELLGMEAGMVAMPGRDSAPPVSGPYRFEPSTHIGGVGLMRVDSFKSRPEIPSRGRFGFTEHQTRYQFVRGWIYPDLLCPSLDRIPEEPFISLAEEYVELGWSRPWPAYSEQWMEPYYDWVMRDERAIAKANRR